jgi:AraC-like DNA-binding protein
MHHTATALASWAIAIRKALDAAGVDSAALFREAGLDRAALDDPDARYPVEKTTRLWQLAVAATGDSGFGLKVASQVTPTTFHALGYAIAASATLKEAFERILRYFKVVTDAAELEFLPRGPEYHFVMRTPETGPQPAREALDAFASMFVRMCRSRAGENFGPLRIELRRPPPDDLAGFERILRAPLRFDAPDNRLVFAREAMERRLEGANPELARHNDEIVVRYLARLDRGNITLRLHAALVEQLPFGEPSAEKIAQSLHLSARSLQRKLAELETSYREVLDQTRRDLALAYLKSRSHSLTEVTFLLGFSDTRSFSRAFRRWTGMAPSEYRERESA